MDKILVDKLVNRVPGMIKHYNLNENDLLKGDWFVFETSPIPSLLPCYEQLEMLTADIDKDKKYFLYNNGTLEHLENCKEKEHYIKKELKTALKNITNQKFRIAVLDNTYGILDGQPLIIPLEPEINLSIYPDHPHINAGGSLSEYCYLPDTICYTNDPSALGDDAYTRTLAAIEESSVWLFKHQIWLVTRKTGKGIWIGPQVIVDEKKQFNFYRNPYGKCWCGSNKDYSKCHLYQDYRYWYKSLSPSIKDKFVFIDKCGNINLEDYNRWWMDFRHKPRANALAQLKKTLV